MNYQGHVEKGMVVLNQPLPLPDGTPVVVEPIAARHGEFWQASSLDELAARQGVVASASAEELLGGWPTDELDDNFEQTLGEWRSREQQE